MNYYVRERKFDDATSKTAWSKAREDAERICGGLGYRPIDVAPEFGDRTNAGLRRKIRLHFDAGDIWSRQLSVLKPGDQLVIQLPVINNCLFLSQILLRARKKGVQIISLIHDLEMLRMGVDKSIRLRSRVRMWIEEKSVLGQCDRVIVHNGKMLEFLAENGVQRCKMIPLGIFDYLMEEKAAAAVEERKPADVFGSLIVAGNLSPEKAGYVYKLPESIPVNLYGVYYRENSKENLRYQGAFPPGELPEKLCGGFGLVWDGSSVQTCSGPYGAYLRYNNPHKTSLYLASGFPVVIWKEAALADFVEREGVGITAASIEEAAGKIARLTGEEYLAYIQNVKRVGKNIRNGEFLKEALCRNM